MNYLSFSLWGDKPIYNVGAIRNAELWKTIYPDWIMVVYYDNTVPTETIEKLNELQVLTIDITKKNIQIVESRYEFQKYPCHITRALLYHSNPNRSFQFYWVHDRQGVLESALYSNVLVVYINLFE